MVLDADVVAVVKRMPVTVRTRGKTWLLSSLCNFMVIKVCLYRSGRGWSRVSLAIWHLMIDMFGFTVEIALFVVGI